MLQSWCRVELIDLGVRHRLRRAARAEILGVDVRSIGPQLQRSPFPPAAVVASVRLFVGQQLAQPFDHGSQVGRIYAG